MTLLVMDGLDHQSTAPRTGVTYDVSPTFGTGRFGGSAAGFGSNLGCRYSITSTGTVVVGHARRTELSNSNSLVVLRGDGGGTAHLTLMALPNGTIEVRRGSTTGTILGATAPAVLTAGVWAYIEVKATLSDTVGVVTIRVNGAEVLNLTGQDTKNAGTGTTFDSVGVTSTGSAGSGNLIDDIYVLDPNGSAPYNDFLGDCKIETIIPSGNGSSSQLTGSDGNSTDNYLLVDERPASTTDYVQSATVGHKDLYAFTDLTTASGSVLAVQTSALALKSDAGSANIKIVERSSVGTERDSASIPLVASPGVWVSTGPLTVDPANATWTISSVNDAQFGAKVA